VTKIDVPTVPTAKEGYFFLPERDPIYAFSITQKVVNAALKRGILWDDRPVDDPWSLRYRRGRYKTPQLTPGCPRLAVRARSPFVFSLPVSHP